MRKGGLLVGRNRGTGRVQVRLHCLDVCRIHLLHPVQARLERIEFFVGCARVLCTLLGSKLPSPNVSDPDSTVILLSRATNAVEFPCVEGRGWRRRHRYTMSLGGTCPHDGGGVGNPGEDVGAGGE